MTVVLALVLLSSSAASGAQSARFKMRGTIARVIDGDTIQVRLASGKSERVRLVGIDAPELSPLECFGRRAKARASQLAQGKRVQLVGDAKQNTRDRYARLLAYVILSGQRDLGRQLIAEGYATVYRRPFIRLRSYQAAQQTAHGATRGLWAACRAAKSPPPPPEPPPSPPPPGPPPPVFGFPDASTTGVRDASLLTAHPASAYTISTPGAIVENKIFTRQVVVAANNVTIRNSIRRGTSDSWGILVNAGVTGTLIEDVEIDGMDSSTIDAGVGGSGGWTGRRLNIHGSADGVKLGSAILVEDSYIHDLKTPPNGAHSDSAQSMGGSNVTLRHNTFAARVGTGQNSSVFLAPDFGPINNYTVDNNLLSGGGYTMWAGNATNSRITNNHFGRLYGWGPVRLGPGWARSGNVWQDTLEPIPGG